MYTVMTVCTNTTAFTFYATFTLCCHHDGITQNLVTVPSTT